MASQHGNVSEPGPFAARPTSKQLYAEALTLPASERAELACSLLERRLAAMDAGQPGIPVAEALAALRQAR